MGNIRGAMGALLMMTLLATAGCGTEADNDTPAEDVTSGDGSTSDGVGGEQDAGQQDAGAPDAGKPPVGALTACAVDAALPQGLVEIAWDDGKGVSDVSKQAEWKIVGKQINATPLHEAVRFDLDQPVRIHGYKIQYGHLPTSGPVSSGLYRDFGHNGFDFWSPDPIWEVSCPVAEMSAGTWTTFKLPKPLVIDQPGLVYVAHRRNGGPNSAAWAFDGSLHPDCDGKAEKCCDKFARCHSAWNFPELTKFTSGGQQNFNWNGLSLTRPTDYLVRLIVEPLKEVKPEETLLQPLGDTKPGHRMAWGDFDNDGWDDLFDSRNKLFRNDKGTLKDVSVAAGFKKLDVKGNGGIWGDFDNDGHLDLFVFWETLGGGDTLLRNKGDGTFEDVTKASGLSDLQSYNMCDDKSDKKQLHTPTPGAAWVDIDADGKLDLYVANFICWPLGTFYVDTIWHNEGGGKFTSWTGKSGFLGTLGKRYAGRGANAVDADGDGHVDVLVNNYRLHRNLYFKNNGDGTVTESALKTGLAGHGVASSGNTHYGHSIGTAWGDLNGDGYFDVVVANLAHPRFWNFSDKTRVLIADGKGKWADNQGDWSIPVGLGGLRFQETHSVPLLADFDLDGHLDLAISATYDGRPSDFYWGLGDGTFSLDVLHAGLTVDNGWGMAAADIDHDGAPDMAAKGVVFRNSGQSLREGAKLGHWLQVQVIGDGKANRAAIGATIRVKSGSKTWLRYVSGGNGQGCQDSLTQHMGLGKLTTIDGIEVVFPGGKKTSFKGPFAVDQKLWLFESGKTSKGWAPPKK
ncbi:MAG: CRTAC1 family protein [Myxococcales bacterium]|nr:CRTAC1 family protein [Myxococcales bacterium]